MARNRNIWRQQQEDRQRSLVEMQARVAGEEPPSREHKGRKARFSSFEIRACLNEMRKAAKENDAADATLYTPISVQSSISAIPMYVDELPHWGRNVRWQTIAGTTTNAVTLTTNITDTSG